MVDRAGEHTCSTARVVALYRAADRVQLARENRRAGIDPDGGSAQCRRDRGVATGRWVANRQVRWPRGLGPEWRAGPYERRDDEGVHARATTDPTCCRS